MTTKLKQELIDKIATLEAENLLEGLNDPALKQNPAFLAKVRQFLKDNDFITTTETDGVKEMLYRGTTIPDLVSEDMAQ